MAIELKANSEPSRSSPSFTSNLGKSENDSVVQVQISQQKNNLSGASLYVDLTKLQKKSTGELVKLIKGWLRKSARDNKNCIVSAGLVDPILINFVNNNYSRSSDKKLLPMPDERLIPISTDKSLNSVEEQKIFLEMELALAAALDHLNDEDFEQFVSEYIKDYTDPNQSSPPGDGAPITAIDNASQFSDKKIEERDPDMLQDKLKVIDDQIIELDQTMQSLSKRIGATSRAAEVDTEKSESEHPASNVAKINALAKRHAELAKAHQVLLLRRKEVSDILDNVRAADSTATSIAKPRQ